MYISRAALSIYVFGIVLVIAGLYALYSGIEIEVRPTVVSVPSKYAGFINLSKYVEVGKTILIENSSIYTTSGNILELPFTAKYNISSITLSITGRSLDGEQCNGGAEIVDEHNNPLQMWDISIMGIVKYINFSCSSNGLINFTKSLFISLKPGRYRMLMQFSRNVAIDSIKLSGYSNDIVEVKTPNMYITLTPIAFDQIFVDKITGVKLTNIYIGSTLLILGVLLTFIASLVQLRGAVSTVKKGKRGKGKG